MGQQKYKAVPPLQKVLLDSWIPEFKQLVLKSNAMASHKVNPDLDLLLADLSLFP
jgi:hypothetical protein